VVSDETKQKLSDSGKARYEDKTSEDYLNTLDTLKQATALSKGKDTTPIPPRQRPDRSGETIDGDYWVSADDF
jgi:hypothetical protein